MNTSSHTVIDPVTTQFQDHPEKAKESEEGKLPALVHKDHQTDDAHVG